MDESQDAGQRVIELTSAATLDLASIDSATAVIWGEPQAERYQHFLREVFSYLAAEPALGESIVARPGIRVHTAQIQQAPVGAWASYFLSRNRRWDSHYPRSSYGHELAAISWIKLPLYVSCHRTEAQGVANFVGKFALS